LGEYTADDAIGANGTEVMQIKDGLIILIQGDI